MSKERDAIRAMLEWVDSNGELVMQSFHMARETAEKSLAELKAVLPSPASEGLMVESIATWRRLHDEFLKLYGTLPDCELF